MIYLDNAATTPVDSEVLKSMMPYLTTKYGNAGSVHSFGLESKAAIENARAQVARLINCTPEHIIFTSGGSEGNSTVFYGIKDYLKEIGKTHIVSSAQEHDSVLHAIESLCIKDGFYSSKVQTNKDTENVEAGDIIASLTKETGIVSVMSMNNETGMCINTSEIGSELKKRNILFHTDCVQAAAYLNIDVDKIKCDFLTMSAHKLHAPKGVGAIYVRDVNLIQPLIYGGANQEFGMRGGTENVAGIVGFGKACELQYENLIARQSHIDCLRDTFTHKLGMILSQDEMKSYYINNVGDNFKKILSIGINGVDSETLVMLLSNDGVMVSSGSACRSHYSEPSHVLKDLGLSDDESRETIRLSFSYQNSVQQVEKAAEIVKSCVDKIKRLQNTT